MSEIAYNPETGELFYDYKGLSFSLTLSEINDKKLMKLINEAVMEELNESMKVA